MNKAKKLQQLAEELRVATELHGQAKAKTSAARTDEIQALNKLNQAQKRFDEAVVEIKKDAPRDSDWRSKRYENGAVVTD